MTARDMRVVKLIYNDQLAVVRLSQGTINWLPIKRGVRQGCIMSLDLFNLYSEMILRKLVDIPEGVIANGVKINNLRYADDTALLALSNEDLQKLFDAAVEASKCLGLYSNSKKRKVGS